MNSNQPGPTTNDLSSEQLLKLSQIYALQIIEMMDTKTLENFAFDVIVNNCENLSQDELFDIIEFDFDENNLSEWVSQVIENE